MNSMPFRQFRVYLKTVNTPKQRVFFHLLGTIFLAIPRVFLQKMASSGGKSLAVGHISGFQIDPNFPKLLRILPDGFELGIGSPIHGINLIKVL